VLVAVMVVVVVASSVNCERSDKDVTKTTNDIKFSPNYIYIHRLKTIHAKCPKMLSQIN